MRNYRELLCVLAAGSVMLLCLGATVSKSKTHELRCQDNLRRLHALTAQYDAEYGRTPPPVVKGKPIFFDSFLRPLTQDRLTFACPADPRNAYLYEPDTPLFPAPPQVVASYGMNFFFTDEAAARANIRPPSLKNVRTPSRMVLFGDCTIPYMKMPWFWEKAYDPRHGGRSWFVFADGSTGLFSKSQFGTTEERWKW